MSLRYLNQVSVERDISKTSQRHLKKDVFFETSLRYLKYISKKTSFLRHLWDVLNASQERCLFWGIFKTFRIHFQKDAFYVTSLRRLGYISKKMSFMWRLEDVSNTSHKRCLLCDVFKISQIHIKKMFFRGRSKKMSPGEGWEEYPKIVTNGDMGDGGRTLKWWRHHCVFVKAVMHSSYDILFYEIF